MDETRRLLRNPRQAKRLLESIAALGRGVEIEVSGLERFEDKASGAMRRYSVRRKLRKVR